MTTLKWAFNGAFSTTIPSAKRTSFVAKRNRARCTAIYSVSLRTSQRTYAVTMAAVLDCFNGYCTKKQKGYHCSLLTKEGTIEPDSGQCVFAQVAESVF
jgi:formate-dependent phosphoribosylglycinamide formyltransferase (GAR transformylase)